MRASQRFVNQGKEILEQLLEFIDDENDNDFLNQIKTTLKEDNEENTELLRLLLIFLSNISKNHHRNHNTIQKIEQCIQQFKDKIKNNLENLEIFKIFEDDKRILYFLLSEKIIFLDDTIISLIYYKTDKNKYRLIHYLYPAIKSQIFSETEEKLKEEISEIYGEDFDTFEKKCLEGENDSFICELIRNDSVEEFITYFNQKQIPLSGKITKSLFETHLFLIENDPTIIEYAAFFGSIQIFQFLKYNNVELEPSLWLYAIHSKNAEIIHLLEEIKVTPNERSYQECLMVAIKCYHNDIASYIEDNLAIQPTRDIFGIDTVDDILYSWSIYAYAFKFYNFCFIDQFVDNKFIILYLCNFDYFYLFKLLLKEKNLNYNVKII